MGHLVAKSDVYRRLATKLDNYHLRTPYSEALYNLLKGVYSPEEAEIIVRMPYLLSGIDRVAKITGYDKKKLSVVLGKLCKKGLIMDIYVHDEYKYMLSPFLVGVFEFTMMRTGNDTDSKKWAGLLSEYFKSGEGIFYKENIQEGKLSLPGRILSHEETIGDHTEIFDYEKASELIEQSDRFAIGLCSCRHQKQHLGERKCNTPLDTCLSFCFAADYLIRNNMAKEVSKERMQENIARSRELGLVLSTDNVKNNVTFLCQCCGCCCVILEGLNKYGHFNTVLTSNFKPGIDDSICTGCGKCATACHVNAIKMEKMDPEPGKKKKQKTVVNEEICLGCGVCALKCDIKALKLVRANKRIILPEDTFARVVLQCLEAGTLQNLMLDNPNSLSQSFGRAIVGAFLKLPPVKKALMSDVLRSTFLSGLKKGMKLRKMGWMTEL